MNALRLGSRSTRSGNEGLRPKDLMLRLIVILTLAGNLSLAGEAETTVTFARDSEGKVPLNWTTARTGKGEGEISVWRVVPDKTAPGGTGFVLAQMAKSPRAVFNLCVFNEAKLQDLELKVAFKAFRGEVDQGVGWSGVIRTPTIITWPA